MSDSDAEFEKFLRESLSSSGVSYKSQPSHSIITPVASTHNYELRGYSKPDSVAVLSDQELEATGNNWLKSSNPPHGNISAAKLSSPIRSNLENYSSDSLEFMKDEAASSNVKRVASSDEDSTLTENTKKLGLDTLEENAEKSKFFAELEQGRNTPIDYAELNKKLGDTGRSSVVDTVTSSLASDNLADQYKEDFESFSSTAGSSSSDSATPTGPRSAAAAPTKTADVPGKLHGFMLSPIHTSEMHSSTLSSNFEHSSVFADIQLPKDTPPKDEAPKDEPPKETDVVKRTQSQPKPAAIPPSERSEGKLLKSRSSKSLVLNTEAPPTATPTALQAKSILPHQELTSSTDSAESSLSPTNQANTSQRRQFDVLEPIRSSSIIMPPTAIASDAVHKTDSSLVSSCVLKPLEVDTVPPRGAAVTTSESTSSGSRKTDGSSAPILSPPLLTNTHKTAGLGESSSRKENVLLTSNKPVAIGDSGNSRKEHTPLSSNKSAVVVGEGGRDGSTPVASQRLTTVPAPSTLHPHQDDNDPAADSLTVVTDVPNSTLGGEIGAEMAELQGALAKAGLPQINTWEQSYRLSPRLVSHTSAHKVEAVEQPPGPSMEELMSGDFDIQEIIRAITAEEVASATKEILEASPKKIPSGKPSKPTHPLQGTQTVRAGPPSAAPAVGAKKRGVYSKTKPAALPASKQKTQLSSSRESLASRSDTSVRKRSAKAGTSSGYGRSSTGPPSVQPRQKGRIPQRIKSGATVGRSSVKPAPKPSPGLSPDVSPPSVRQDEKSLLSGSESSDTFVSEKSSSAERVVEIPSGEQCLISKHSPRRGERLVLMETEFKEKEKQMKLLHEREILELKQELFAQSVKLKDLEVAQSSRKLLASGRDPNMLISQEEKLSLQREIKEQEVLLQGYQKENERLCAELSIQQVDSKTSLNRLYQENQRLASEVALTKAQMEVQSRRQPHETTHPTGSSSSELADMAAAQIAKLEDSLEREAGEKRELNSQVKQLKHLSHCLEQEVKTLKQINRELEGKVQERVRGEVLEQLKKKHQEEIVQMKEKLSHSADKLRLLDRTAELLKAKETEVDSLKQKLAVAESSRAKSAKAAAAKGARERASEAKRVTQLEKQVRELEKVIQKRFPNSVSALILAANSSTQQEMEKGKQAVEARNKELEGCVKELKGIMETAERESEQKYAALEQQYRDLQIKHEQQAAVLERGEQHTRHTRHSPHSKHSPLPSRSPHSDPPHPSGSIPPPSSNPRPHSREDERGARDDGTRSGADVSSLMSENAQLKGKLSEVSFELAHQRVQLEGKLAEAERKASLISEEAEKKLSALREEQRAEVDSLLAKFARDNAQSDAVRLQSQLKAKEATIVLLREQILCLEQEAGQLAASQAREEELLQRLKTTSDELREAKQNLTPEMHHFMLLQTKIAGLEERNRDFEAKNKLMWQNMRQPSSPPRPSAQDIREIELKWRSQLVAKNAEIEQYREELDALLAALRVLQQGASQQIT